MPLIARQLGVPESSVWYHDLLLSRYFVHDPQDEDPPLLMAFYVLVLLLVSASLILIIHNSFAVSMNSRIRQFGIFSSVGATPGQIRICLLEEAAILCVVPIILGNLIGTALSFCVIQTVNALAERVADRHEAVFVYHPLVFSVTILISMLTVFISAWLPARKLSRLTPMEAIKNTGELEIKRMRHSLILPCLFGIEGELAKNALKAQKKALRTSTLSLTFSFLGFTFMLSFFALSEISTGHTYFERYQEAWDVMATVKDVSIDGFAYEEEIHALDDTDSIIYQKANACTSVPAADISEEVKNLGGVEKLAGSAVEVSDDAYTFPATLVIMDDRSFAEYCDQIGVLPSKQGCIVLNRIWNSRDSNFRYKEYVSCLSEKKEAVMQIASEETSADVAVPVLGYTQKPPVLREEYNNYTLVQFLSASAWKQLEKTLGNAEQDTYIRVLSTKNRTLTELNWIENGLAEILGQEFDLELENRIQEKTDNDAMLSGYKLLIGSLCSLLALIGIANVFSNTLGFIRQRKREFARYLSIGMTPEGMRKIFLMEALVLAGRPVLISLPVTGAAVCFMITASYLDPMEFLAAAPIVPALIFAVAIFGFVGLAYYIGGKKILNCNLVEALQSDYMK